MEVPPRRTVQVEELTLGRLHRDPVTATHSRVEAHLGTREALWSPPLCDLLRIDHRVEHTLPRGLEDGGEIDGQLGGHGVMLAAPSMQPSVVP
jgi:hypothetical protein